MNTVLTQPNIKLAVPFVMVADMQVSLSFYTDRLGFEKKIDWTPHGKIEWCWLERGGAALMLQEYRPGRMPAEKRGAGVSIGFICEDVLQLYHELLQKGLKPGEPFVGNKMWVTYVDDPDGYHLFFESATDLPEETTYHDWVTENQGS